MVWFEPQWTALVELSTQAAPAYAALVTDAHEQMRRAAGAAVRHVSLGLVEAA